jgi:peptide/nickel transport system ATP-binding protein
MYAGKIVETGPTEQVLNQPLHPYTEGLLSSLPQRAKPGSPLATIPGQVPTLLMELPGCGFCERCPHRDWKCSTEPPPLRERGAGHFVRCWKHA